MKWKRLALMGAASCISACLIRADDFDKELAATLKLVVMVHAQLAAAPVFGAGIVFGREKDRLYILTANHVVRRGNAEATGIQVKLRSHPGQALGARLLPKADRDLDIAVLAVDNLASQGVDICALQLDRLGDPADLKRGSDVYPVGNPNGAAWGMAVKPDQVSMVTRDEIAFQSPFLAVGMSGGALLNEDADLVAMVRKDEPPFGLALSLDKALATIAKWGYPEQLWQDEEDRSTPLHKAATDPAKVKALLAEVCVDVNPVDKSANTPLYYAAREGKAEVIQLLLQAGAKVGVRGEYQLTPLHEAAGKGSVAAATLLVAAGADVDAADDQNLTPLYNAVAARSPEMVKFLLAHGAKVNTASAALSAAAGNGDVEILRQLLAAGASVNASWRSHGTALEAAVRSKSLEAVRVLLAAGADARSVSWDNAAGTMLHLAARQGWVDGMKLLLAAGAPLDVYALQGETPLLEAVISGSPAAVELLIASGAGLAVRKDRGENLLCLASRLYSSNNQDIEAARLEIFKTLIAHSGGGIDTLAGPYSGEGTCRLFDRAAENGEVDFVKALLAAGADPNGKELNHPLITAAAGGQAEIVRILMDAKVNLNATDASGVSALDATLDGKPTKGRLEIARLLLAAGVKVNTAREAGGTGAIGWTPLHSAVASRWPVEIVKLLLAGGADRNAANDRRQTPISIATELNENCQPPFLHSSVWETLAVPRSRSRSFHVSPRYSLGRMPVVRAIANRSEY
jgi:ankyrin repeat protein